MENDFIVKIDFYKILEQLFEYVSISDTIEVLKQQKINTKKEDLENLIFSVFIIKYFYETYIDYPDSNLESIKSSLERLEKENSFINLEEFKNIILFLKELFNISSFFKFQKENLIKSIPMSYFENLLNLLCFDSSMYELLNILKKHVDINELKLKHGVVKQYDDINFKIKVLDKRIEKQLKNIVDNRIEYLSSGAVYFKFERYALALKANFKGRLPGNILSSSKTGETLYIEPNEVVTQNNELNYLKFEREKIVIQVLKQLSNKLHYNIKNFKKLYYNFLYYDSLKARAIYGIKTKGIFPKVSDKLKIIAATHPLIKNPIKISFDPDNKRCIVVTGPNAGGKTVTLKTIALLSAMFQFGIPITVSEESEFKIFDNILIDIGDEQSISSSLSTFSAHMTNIAYILKKSTRNSLVIFDEFCSGTDIEQGQALAVAILEHLIKINPYILLTTHYSALKYFAYTHDNVVNASMEMNKEIMSPSYKLIFGLPGDSYAFVVARNSLVNEDMLNRASEIYSLSKTETNSILDRLILREKELYNKEKLLQKEQSLLLIEQKKIKDLQNNLISKELDLEERLIEEQVLFFRKARQQLENLNFITEAKNLDDKDSKQFISYLKENMSSKNDRIKELKQRIVLKKELVIGDKVKIKNLNVKGEVIGIRGKNFVIGMGVFKLIVPFENLTKIIEHNEGIKKSLTQGSVTYSVETSSKLNNLTINIRGMRVNQAIEVLVEQVDVMLLERINKFEILHGKGEGHLQKLVHDFLKKSSFVKKYYFASLEQGGSGKTIVELIDNAT